MSCLLCSFIHGSGNNKRNYIFAEDVAAAFDKIIHQGVVGACSTHSIV
jgi:dTDP-D-glucose 4,6-dehydratase